ncbi:hypothetical protein QTP88_005751 [Uroleucon formosanum]
MHGNTIFTKPVLAIPDCTYCVILVHRRREHSSPCSLRLACGHANRVRPVLVQHYSFHLGGKTSSQKRFSVGEFFNSSSNRSNTRLLLDLRSCSKHRARRLLSRGAS